MEVRKVNIPQRKSSTTTLLNSSCSVSVQPSSNTHVETWTGLHEREKSCTHCFRSSSCGTQMLTPCLCVCTQQTHVQSAGTEGYCLTHSKRKAASCSSQNKAGNGADAPCSRFLWQLNILSKRMGWEDRSSLPRMS